MRAKIIAAIICIIQASVLFAQECPDPQKLDDILTCLKTRHYLVQLNDFDIKRSEGLAKAMGQRPNPMIEVQAVRGGDARQTQVILAQEIDLGGRLSALRKKGEILHSLNMIKRSITQDEIVENVLLHIHHLIHLNETIKVNEEVLSSLESVIRALSKRPVLTPEQEASLLNFKLQKAEVRNILTLLLDEEEEVLLFFYLNGGYSKVEVLQVMKDHHHPLELNSTPDTASLTLTRLAMETKLAREELKVQKAAVWEGFSIGPMYMDDKMAGESEQMFGAMLKMPIPLWQRNEGNRALAQAVLSSSIREFNLFEKKENLEKSSLMERISNLKQGLAKLPPSSELTASHRRVEKLYSQGLISSNTYLDSHRIWRDVTSSKLELEEKILVLTIQYYRLIGKLNEVHL